MRPEKMMQRAYPSLGMHGNGLRRRLPLVLVIEKGLFAAAHKSAIAQVFGRRHDRPIHAAWRPASEKRQGTKSRGGDGSGAAGAMGILPRAQAYEF